MVFYKVIFDHVKEKVIFKEVIGVSNVLTRPTPTSRIKTQNYSTSEDKIFPKKKKKKSK
jgi:hypothetical protein